MGMFSFFPLPSPLFPLPSYLSDGQVSKAPAGQLLCDGKLLRCDLPRGHRPGTLPPSLLCSLLSILCLLSVLYSLLPALCSLLSALYSLSPPFSPIFFHDQVPKLSPLRLITRYSALYHLPFTLYSLPSALYPLLSTLYSLPSALYPLLFALYSLPSALYPILSTLCPLPSALCPLPS